METVPLSNSLTLNLKDSKLHEDGKQKSLDAHMTSSIISTLSSLPSPVDSGVQLMDSESELNSVMTTSNASVDLSGTPEKPPDSNDNNFEDLNVVCKEIVLDIVNRLDQIKLDLNECGTEETEQTNNIEEKIVVKEHSIEQEIKQTNSLSIDKVGKHEGDKQDQIHLSNCEPNTSNTNNTQDSSLQNVENEKLIKESTCKSQVPEKCCEITKSDILNQNVCCENYLSCSVPNYFDKFSVQEEKNPKLGKNFKSLSDEVFEMEHPIKSNPEDLMNISLNSYELLDYTLQNTNLKPPNDSETLDMHVSMSEEVNENLKVKLTTTEPIPEKVEEEMPKQQEEQIVFRRQRKKKSKSDTPKKRVSFHEDILNSTKVDDVHVNLGFVTHEPDVSFSFFQRGFSKKPDVVQGRYSWAAEGDAPYYEKNASMKREIQSDIYINNSRLSSTSSSSTGSASSIDEEDSQSDENVPKKEPTNKLPKSSCLKKTRQKKYIDTKIVQEEPIPMKKNSQTNLNLLDKNIFGSLKNILNFSTSVPLAERGVPEGQEDVAIYSSSHDITNNRRSFADFSYIDTAETKEVTEVKPETSQSKMNFAKTNLKLGFYPNYQAHKDLPANAIICDSNVYEHKGISYSYEYDAFQRSFERQKEEPKPKSSSLYQTIFKEFNFFRRKTKVEADNKNIEDDFEVIENSSTPTKSENRYSYVEEVVVPDQEEEKTPVNPKTTLTSYPSTLKMDWSDTDTVSDMTDGRSSKHLESPKRKINKTNHYSVQNSFKFPFLSDNKQDTLQEAKSLPNMRQSGSKTSLINRFLKNVTAKKILDLKAQQRDSHKFARNYLGLYVKNCKFDPESNQEFDSEIQKEVLDGRGRQFSSVNYDSKLVSDLKKRLLRNKAEKILRIYPIRSAYSTNGDSKPLILILTDTTLYIASSKQTNHFSNNFVLPYADLNAILTGPSGQAIHFSNYDLDMQCMVSTGCSRITGDLIGQLEMAMRRDKNRPKLPAVRQLCMRDMAELRRAICKQTSVDKDEDYYYYSIVNIQDCDHEEFSTTPTGPAKEGPLMFKTPDYGTGRWETAYFILKAGVLYMLSSASQKVPMRVFPLINGSCQGARRVFNTHRPHTFQVIIEGKSLQLAAPDEYVASEWLQEIIHAASGIYQKERHLTLSCSLMMTSEHILTVRETFPSRANPLLPKNKNIRATVTVPQALSCAAITDLVTFRLPSAEQSWCILEFSCREVHEYSGDWILYFASNAELEHFISTLEMLWQYNNEEGESFPLSTIPETDPINKKCVDVYSSLMGQWPVNTVHLQFL